MSCKAVIFTFAVVIAASPCLAEQGGVHSANVSLKGIDLGSDAGQALLHARLQRAARNVCGEADVRDLSAMADLKACRSQATQQGEILLQAALARPRRTEGGNKLASAGPNS